MYFRITYYIRAISAKEQYWYTLGMAYVMYFLVLVLVLVLYGYIQVLVLVLADNNSITVGGVAADAQWFAPHAVDAALPLQQISREEIL